MININYKGLFGNNLFQASVANFLAKKHNQNIDTKFNKFIKTHKTKKPNNTQGKVIVNDKNIQEIYNQESITQDLILDDFFQTRFCVEKINEYNEYTNTMNGSIDATFVHIRLGDIKNKMSIEYDYYDEAIKKYNNTRIIISSDSPNDEMVQKLAKEHGADIFVDNIENTIMTGANCKNKILSMGTFSWWIGFLGNKFLADQRGFTICPKEERSIKWHGDIFPIFDWEQV